MPAYRNLLFMAASHHSERVHAVLAKAREPGRIGCRPRLVLDHRKVVGLRQEGCTIREIADEMGTAPANIHRLMKSHRCEPGEIVPM
jgi:hypothetical protein